ncbi:hypothetical protein CEW81_05890 [Kluyvera genomosp. 3]|uniref:Ead/Ea22-like family protein n=1 Tax=Kluyvera genomosp. 3 TaxID=2774055 RepID=A0A248KH43_9ENTR|nr:hypothetical protein CEW81_05890 [Kluyvera genomosp. 3]
MNDITALAQRMSVERILEIAKGGTPTIGEKERLAITALYFHQELQVCTQAFQAAGLAQLAGEDALEKAQQRIAELESCAVELPLPSCTYADHSYPAYSKRQVVSILVAAGIQVIEGEGQ